MISFFTTMKPFTGHNGVIQRNALRSWAQLTPRPEIIIMGEADGVEEICAELDCRHVPDIQVSEKGVPYVDAMFRKANEIATHDILCFSNGDIIFMDDLIQTVTYVSTRHQRYVIAGQRVDVDITEQIVFEAGWQLACKSYAQRNGNLHGPDGIDYFVFSKGILDDLPPLVVGRQGWDNYLIYHVISQGIPFIDATASMIVIHQNHDYHYVPGGRVALLDSADTKQNRQRLSDVAGRVYTLLDAKYVFDGQRTYRVPNFLLQWRHLAITLYNRYPSVQFIGRYARINADWLLRFYRRSPLRSKRTNAS